MRFFNKKAGDDDPRAQAAELNDEGLTKLRQSSDAEGAMVYFKRAIRIDPNFADPYANLADCLRAAGDWAEAIALYSKAIEKNPQHMRAYYQRALTYAETKLFNRALLEFERLVELGGDRELGIEDQVAQQIERLHTAISIEMANSETKVIRYKPSEGAGDQ